MARLWFPSLEVVLALHDEILARTGGEAGVLSRSPIESALHWAAHGPLRRDAPLPLRAAFLLRGIAQEHPFADGNKRTAFEVADLFLSRNGYYIEARQEEIEDFMLAVASDPEVGLAKIDGWIARRLRKL